MLRNRLVYLVVLIILVLFRIAYTGYVAGLLLLLALLLPIFSWLITLPGALCLVVNFSVPDQVVRGSEAHIALALKQSRLFSVGRIRGNLKVVNSITGESHKVKLKSAYGKLKLDTSHCCTYTISMRSIRVLDFLGLLPMPRKKVAGTTISVVPFPEEPPEHPDWMSDSSLIAKPFSGGTNPYDLREYRTGDTMRSIHWKKSAALDKTVVRDTLEPVERIASIWIDWPRDADGRDLALDQLAWCLIYLNQNNAGLLLNWLDARGQHKTLFAPQGQVNEVMPKMLSQKAGSRCPASMLTAREILLSGDAATGGAI